MPIDFIALLSEVIRAIILDDSHPARAPAAAAVEPGRPMLRKECLEHSRSVAGQYAFLKNTTPQSIEGCVFFVKFFCFFVCEFGKVGKVGKVGK